MMYNSLAHLIIEARQPFTQKHLAELVGLSPQFICDVEKGRRGLSGKQAKQFAKKLMLPQEKAHHLQMLAAQYAGFDVYQRIIK